MGIRLDRETVELADQILRSYYFEAGPTRVNRNNYGVIPGVKSAPMQFDFPIFVDLPSITLAGLMLRKMMPTQFGSVSLKKAEEFIQKTVEVDFASFFDRKPSFDQTTNYLTAIDEAWRAKFNVFVLKTLMAGPPIQTFSFPLSRVSVLSQYDGNSFYVISGDDIGGNNPESTIESFKAKQTINAWIGCSAAFAENTQKTKRIVLGAMSLRLPRIERTQKIIATPANGFVAHNPLGWNSSREHMPPIGYDVTVEEDDNWWLKKIDRLVEALDKPSRRLRKATEYFYLGWFLEPNERFAFNFMTLDALFGQGKGRTAEKLKDGISSTLGQKLDVGRFDDLADLRAQFLHGGSPDIYDSSKYESYIRRYKCDPIIDSEYLAASSLRRLVFGPDFKMQPNPYEALIQKQKNRGLIPIQPTSQTIIREA